VGERDDAPLPFLRFSADAQVRFDAWRGGLEQRLRADDDEHPVVVSHLAKYRSLVPALALIFHLVECVDTITSGPVSLAATGRAIAWTEYLEAHARRVYHAVTDGIASATEALAKKLRAGKLDSPFLARALIRKHWAGLTDVQDVLGAIDALIDLHWLRREDVVQQGRGRPTVQYHVNPGIASLLSPPFSENMAPLTRATLSKRSSSSSFVSSPEARHSEKGTDEGAKNPQQERATWSL
jgi:putative DNA primase/helicase